MIELRDISKSYDGEAYAVRKVDLRVEAGELVSLIGESGCGKTTTLKLINRLVDPTSGTVSVGGRNVAEQNPVELRRSIGYVFQGIGLFPHYTVSQNIAAVPSLLGWDRGRIRERVTETLTLVGLPAEEYWDRYPWELSGGQQQRVGVARALAAQPGVMLMDEPFGALDPITRAEIQDQFVDICRQLRLTVVLVTHDMTEALLMADRIAVMRSGELLQVDTPHELLTNPRHEYVQALVQMPKERADRLEALVGNGKP